METIGSVAVEIIGDYSQLNDDLRAAQSVAEKGGRQIAESLESAAESADTLSSAVTGVASSMGGLESQAAALASSSSSLASALADVGSGADEMASGLTDTGQSAAEAAGEFGTFEEQIAELVASGSTLNEALATVAARSEEMAAATGEAGDAASGAAEQLGLFNEEAQVDYSDTVGQLNLFATELEPIGANAEGAAGALDDLGSAAGNAGKGFEEAAPPIEQTTVSMQGLVEQLVAVGAALEFTSAMVDFGHAALEAADAVDDATASMAMLGGSAQEAELSVSQLRDIANDSALSFPEVLQASTRMTAFLGSAQPVPAILQAVANSAAVMGTSIEAASGGFERIIASGDISTKSLMRLGLTMDDIAKAMGTTADKAKDAFKELDQTQKIEVMNAALNKFQGAAAKLSNDGLGGLVRMGNAWREVLEAVGTAIDPVIKAIADFMSSDVVPFVKGLVEAFQLLPDPIQKGAIGIAALLAAIVPIVGVVAGVSAAFSALSGALAPVLVSFAGLSAAITGATASWSAFLASGALSVVGWVAVVAAIYSAVKAYGDMQDAIAGAEKATQTQIAGLSKLEGSLRAQGANITELMQKYHSGQITWTQYMVALRDVSAELGKANKAHQDHATAVTASATAAEGAKIKIASLKDAVSASLQALQAATQNYNAHKGSAEDVAKAYDKWQAASKALKGAQEAHIPVLKAFADATRAFNAATLEYPSAAQAVINALDAEVIKRTSLNDSLISAQRNLDNVLERYRNHAASSYEVAKALDRLKAAQDGVNKAMTEMEPPAAKWLPAVAAFDQARVAIEKIIPPLNAAPLPIRTAASALQDMGVSIDEVSGKISNKLLKAYDELGTKAHTLTEEKAAWDAVRGAVDQLASVDLPKAMTAYQQHYIQMQQRGAKQAELLDLESQALNLQIKTAELSGASAASQIIALENVRLKQQALYDSTHMLGQLYVDVTGSLLKGLDSAGAAIGDVIFESKKLGDVFIDIGKQIAKSLVESAVGVGIKALKAAILGVNTDVKTLDTSLTNLGKKIIDLFGGGGQGSTPSAPANPFAGGNTLGGGALGVAGAISSIGTLISSIVGNFQMAKLETTMNAVEKNTRFTQLILEQFKADSWQQAGDLLTKLDLLINELRSASYAISQEIAQSFSAATFVTALQNSQNASTGALISAFNSVMMSGVTAINNMLQSGFTGLASTFASSFTGLANVMVSGFQAVIQTLAGVKKYAGGGPVSETGLAMLHAGEFVVPAGAAGSSPSASTYSSSNSTTNNSTGAMTFNIYGSSDPRETARQVAGVLKKVSPRFAVYAT